MWKYVSRRIKDSFDRGANCFDIRGSYGATNATQPTTNAEISNQLNIVPKTSFKCNSRNDNGDGDTHEKYWYYDCQFAFQRWLGTISLGSALVLGWYGNQILHLRQKCCLNNEHPKLTNTIVENIKKLKFNCKNQKSTINIELENILNSTTHKSTSTYNQKDVLNLTFNHHSNFDIKLLSNENDSGRESSSENTFSNVLNSIENRLGLAAIEQGQHHDGLQLLRSAAKRNHPPALYNLALCYENGFGVIADEKAAMELYRAAALHEHPSALYNLAVFYGQGRGGLERNLVTAHRLMRAAAARGQPEAKAAMKVIEDDFNVEVPAQTSLYIHSILSNSLLV